MSTSVTAQFEGSVAVVGASPRGDESQDRGSAFGAAGYGAVVVCDGVGSYDRSGDVAEVACRLAEGHVRKADGVGGIADLPGFLETTFSDVGIGATTLLALAADRSGEVGYCMIGNGLAIEAHAIELDDDRVHVLHGVRAAAGQLHGGATQPGGVPAVARSRAAAILRRH